MYDWAGGDTPLNRKYNAVEPARLLSVTSIRTLNGEPFRLVNWKIGNVVRLAMGIRKAVRIGPRGGVKEVWVKDGEFPGDFVRRLLETNGQEEGIKKVKAWLRAQADEPRDVAAVRGSVVHKLIELNVPMRMLSDELIEQRFGLQRAEDRKSVAVVTADDINFVRNGMAQYRDMRDKVPFIILAQEPQVFNLEAGFGGSADALIWFLGHFEGGDFIPLPNLPDMVDLQRQADAGIITIEAIEAIGGTLGVGDWKTAAGIYTNHVVQITAYGAGGFIATDGLIDERLTAILRATMMGFAVHIRPNAWAVDGFPMREDVLLAFLGSVAFARFLAMYPEPDELFTYQVKGQAAGTGESELIDDESE